MALLMSSLNTVTFRNLEVQIALLISLDLLRHVVTAARKSLAFRHLPGIVGLSGLSFYSLLAIKGCLLY